MENRIKFIVNPVAGQGAGKLAFDKIDHLARQSAMSYEIVTTGHPGHAIELASIAARDGWDAIVAVGGDGTANEVLNGIMRANKEGHTGSHMGIISIGRGNDFAFGAGIPAGLEAGFQAIKQNQVKPIDVGFVVGGDYPQGRFFGNGVGIGFDAVVGFEAAKLTRYHGFLNYIIAALRTIFLYFNAPMVQIDYGDVSLKQPALMVSVMNGRRMGGGFMMAPRANTDDGLLDLCIAGQLSRVGILRLIPQFMKGTQSGHPQVKTGTAPSVHVTALSGSLPAHADGETLCKEGKELRILLIKQPIMIIHG